MAFVNYNNKEITVKIVYYGPALSGKTTCLRHIYASREVKKKGKLITLDTDGDRTLFFDFLPLEIGKLGDYSVKIQLYTVPGQVAYDTTRKLVLQGADGVVFVADSQVSIREQNVSSFKNLKRNLALNNISYSEIPIILQYNKRDLKEILPVDELNRDLNSDNKPFFSTVATSGDNILESLHTIMRLVVISLKNRLSIFQKDKTVMFSRDEITSSSPEAPAPNPFEMKAGEDEGAGDTEAEDIFELGAPLDAEEAPGEDEDIFDLSDDQAVAEAQSPAIEIPEFDQGIEAEEQSPQLAESPKPGGQDSTDYWDQSGAGELQVRVTEPNQEVRIPIKLKIPAGMEESTIQVKLDISIKRES